MKAWDAIEVNILIFMGLFIFDTNIDESVFICSLIKE